MAPVQTARRSARLVRRGSTRRPWGSCCAKNARLLTAAPVATRSSRAIRESTSLIPGRLRAYLAPRGRAARARRKPAPSAALGVIPARRPDHARAVRAATFARPTATSRRAQRENTPTANIQHRIRRTIAVTSIRPVGRTAPRSASAAPLVNTPPRRPALARAGPGTRIHRSGCAETARLDTSAARAVIVWSARAGGLLQERLAAAPIVQLDNTQRKVQLRAQFVNRALTAQGSWGAPRTGAALGVHCLTLERPLARPV